MSGGAKETPRQKMIGMMYLVLTAMLALNVSAEVLNAFGQFETRLSQTVKIFGEKNNNAERIFKQASLENGERVGPWLKKATDVREKTQVMKRYIEDVKIEIVKLADGPEALAIVDNEVEGEHLLNVSNLDASSHVMINGGKGAELRKKIEEYKATMLGLVDPSEKSLIENISNTLSTEPLKDHDGVLKDWEFASFSDLPLIAAIPLLTKIQLDLINTEADMLDYFMKQTDMGTVKIDNFDPVVQSASDYVIRGGEFDAQIFLAASDKTLKPEIIVGGRSLPIVDGKGVYKAPANQVGEQTISGTITLNKKPYSFTYSYMVAEPNVVVSPSKMNVFYRGVENPIDISAAGIPDNKIQIHVTNGTLNKKGGGYVVVPGNDAVCDISVVAEINNTHTNMGKRTFRVKAVPVPTPEMDGIAGRTATKSQLVASQGVRAKMPADFDFDLRFTIQSFVVFATVDGYTREEPSNGQMFTEKQKQIMGKLSAGQRLSITEIKAAGPSGVVDLPDLSIKLR